MSISTIATESLAKGWRLELRNVRGWPTTMAIRDDGELLGCVFRAAIPEQGWRLGGVTGLPLARFDEREDAMAWLVHMTQLNGMSA